MSDIIELGRRAKAAAQQIAGITTRQKNDILLSIADKLVQDKTYILGQNALDIEAAKKSDMPKVMLDRLLLTDERIAAIAQAVREVVSLDDPVGMIVGGGMRENGLKITQVRVPLGVVGIIFESRPNVTVDAAVLCIKSGNAAFLRGGKEAIRTNTALAKSMQEAIEDMGFPKDMLILLEDTSRESANQMMKLNGYLDVMIPRGGAGLIKAVVSNATVPVIETGIGNCHIYVDQSAELKMATSIVDNAKTSRPSVCNACESLLVHRDVASEFLPMLEAAFKTHNVQIFGCERTREILGDNVILATDEDYAAEYLNYKISVKVVEDINAAIEHINKYSTKHSEAIITENYRNAVLFTTNVDAAAVYVNASTRFTDGGEFGLGAEIGISTQKLHARGPMGLCALTTIKYIVEGSGQIR